MRIFKTIIPVFVALLLLAPVGAFAANVKISGKVIDSQGAPLAWSLWGRATPMP